MASSTQAAGEEARPHETQTAGEEARRPDETQTADEETLEDVHETMVLALLRTIEMRVTAIERRQCDASGEGTDASRMVEMWTRGVNANVTEAVFAHLMRRVIMTRSPRSTSYACIFGEKDYVRAEKLVWIVFKTYHLNEWRGHMDSEEYEDMGASLCDLPIFRGKQSMAAEIQIKYSGTQDAEFIEAMTPSTYFEELSEAYKACQELMTPLDTRFQCTAFHPPPAEEDRARLGHNHSNNWRELRHNLRRVSILRGAAHPFEPIHFASDEQLFNLVPEDIKRMLNACCACDNIEESPRCNELIRLNHELAITANSRL